MGPQIAGVQAVGKWQDLYQVDIFRQCGCGHEVGQPEISIFTGFTAVYSVQGSFTVKLRSLQ